jgi:hypothetical protein
MLFAGFETGATERARSEGCRSLFHWSLQEMEGLPGRIAPNVVYYTPHVRRPRAFR